MTSPSTPAGSTLAPTQGSASAPPGYRTAHQLARDLLALPDHICILALPTFDMTGCATAQPVKAEVVTVQNINCIILKPADAERSE
jgi:hypothetical protein